MQLKLFNEAYYDENRNAYIIETPDTKIVIFANQNGSVKKTQGLKHHRNKYETTSAKAMAIMVANEMQRNYVEPDNLLPKIYDQEKKVIRYSYILDKRLVTYWEKCVANLIRLGCSVRTTANPNLYSIVYDGRDFDETRHNKCKTFMPIKTTEGTE